MRRLLSSWLLLLLFIADELQQVKCDKLLSVPLYSSRTVPPRPDGLRVNGSTTSSERVKDLPGQDYYIRVKIGTPPQTLNVLVDTGSSNFAVAAVSDLLVNKRFVVENSSTFRFENVDVVVPYTVGRWEGFLGSDVVELSNVTGVRTDVACIQKAKNFFINGSDWQGILGLAYAAIAKPSDRVVPFLDALVRSGIVENIFSLQLCGDRGPDRSSGRLVFGGIDPNLHEDQVRYTPIHREWYYDVILTSIAVGKDSLKVDCKQLNNDKSIVDSGTTNLLLPTCVYDMLIESLKKTVHVNVTLPLQFWNGTINVCSKDSGLFLDDFPELRLSLAHTANSTFTLVISPKQYLRLIAEDVVGNMSCYKFAIGPSKKGTVIGATIMEGFYVVFDRKNKRVGFAKSVCNPHGSNAFGAEIEGPFPHSDPWECIYTSSLNPSTLIVSYIVIILAIICSIPLLLLFVQWIREKLRRRFSKQSDNNNLIDD